MESLHEVGTDNNEMHENGVGSEVVDVACGSNPRELKWTSLVVGWNNIIGLYVVCSSKESTPKNLTKAYIGRCVETLVLNITWQLVLRAKERYMISVSYQSMYSVVFFVNPAWAALALRLFIGCKMNKKAWQI